jgi:SAM-dependent methyltransferase
MTTPSLETVSLPACPVCAGAQLRTVETVPDAYIPLLVLQQCAQCGVIFLNPRLTHESIIVIENASTVYDLTDDEAEQIIAGSSTQAAQYLAGFARSGGRRWLDIGCNRGLLLEAVRRLGWQPVGVEIAAEATRHARQQYDLTVYSDLDALAGEAPFDMITAWHVLEHTTDPVGFLRAAAAKLTPGGVLALQVPAYDYRVEYAERGQLSGLICSVHNFYFTLDGLRQVLSRTGLHPLRLEADPQYLWLTAICSNRPPAVSLRQRLRRRLRLP